MRMDPTEGFTAADLVNRLPERELADVIYRWGEEHASRRIARAIVETRRRRHFTTTTELAEVVRRAAGRSPSGSRSARYRPTSAGASG